MATTYATLISDTRERLGDPNGELWTDDELLLWWQMAARHYAVVTKCVESAEVLTVDETFPETRYFLGKTFSFPTYGVRSAMLEDPQGSGQFYPLLGRRYWDRMLNVSRRAPRLIHVQHRRFNASETDATHSEAMFTPRADTTYDVYLECWAVPRFASVTSDPCDLPDELTRQPMPLVEFFARVKYDDVQEARRALSRYVQNVTKQAHLGYVWSGSLNP